MTAPKARRDSDIGVLTHALKKNSTGIIARCTAAYTHERREQASPAVLEPLQKNLPQLLDELISLLPHAMAEEGQPPSLPAAGMECRAEHRLDMVVKTLTGLNELVGLELLHLRGQVADSFLGDAHRETRLFFDLKIASYCLQFVAAQGPHLALRTRQLQAAHERLMAAPETSGAAAHSRLQLLQGVVHELRNYLQSVMLHAEAVTGDPRAPGMAEIMDRLAMNGLHLQRLLDRIHTYAPFLAGGLHTRLASVDLGTFLSALEHRHHALAKATQTRLVCRQTGGPAQITTDVDLLNTIADNLVSNALHSARSGRVQVEISEEGPGGILLKVTDDGGGISLAASRQLFRVMHHVAGSYSRGLKLGLLASRYLTHVLGGELTFESQVGQGAAFRVALPGA